MTRRLTILLATVAVAVVGFGQPALAATTDRMTVLSSWTQTSVTSYNAWNSARQNQGAWSAYQFDWSTDYCTDSPDNPLGFDFKLACYRHDFGYRNYKAAGQFAANKSHIDSAFYADLKRRCATYSALVRPACLSLAWTYYEAVRTFGSVVVSKADINRAAELLP